MRLHAVAGELVLVIATTGCGLIPEPQVGLACQIPAGRPETVEAMREVPNLIGKTPQETAALLEADDAGVEVTWRYHYSTQAADDTVGYSECWCIPPPDGEVSSAEITEFNQLLIFVSRDGSIIGGRPQPTLGWGCEEAAEDTSGIGRGLT
jgi:hypothetical protein